MRTLVQPLMNEIGDQEGMDGIGEQGDQIGE
jgi:hypothetical protein